MLMVNQLIGFGGGAIQYKNIQFVGYAKAGKVGATSGTSTLTLSSGLLGGIRSSVQEGDIVIAAMSSATLTNVTLSINSGYTLIGSELYGNASGNGDPDTNLRVAYKIMGSLPDSTVTFGPSGYIVGGATTMVFVFANVDTTNPLDVAATTAINVGGGYPNPPAITPSTPGSFIVAVGGMSEGQGTAGLSNNGQYVEFQYVQGPDEEDNHLGMGYKNDWVSGSFDPLAFTGNGDGTSWAALTMALRPGIQ